jgi:hypothetical protein
MYDFCPHTSSEPTHKGLFAAAHQNAKTNPKKKPSNTDINKEKTKEQTLPTQQRDTDMCVTLLQRRVRAEGRIVRKGGSQSRRQSTHKA